MNEPTDALDRLLARVRRGTGAAILEAAPSGFADRVLGGQRARSGAWERELYWLAWRRLTTWAAGLMGSAALVTSLAMTAPLGSGSAQDSSGEDALEWEQQIETWVLEP